MRNSMHLAVLAAFVGMPVAGQAATFTFQAPASYSSRTGGTETAQSLLLVDFNADGRSDVLVNNAQGASSTATLSLIANAAGAYSASPESFGQPLQATGNVNGDASPDFAYYTVDAGSGASNPVSYRLVNTLPVSRFQTPVLLPQRLSVSPSTRDAVAAPVAIGNFDGVGGSDVLLGSYRSTGGSVVLLTDGGATRGTAADGVSYRHVAVIDQNRDGIKESAAVRGDNVGPNTIVEGLDLRSADSPRTLVANLGMNAPVQAIGFTDSNGDGLEDMVAFGLAQASASGARQCQFRSYLHDGGQSQNLLLAVASASCSDALAIGDFDGDGKRDVLGRIGTKLDFYRGAGDGGFVFDQTLNLPSDRGTLYDVKVGDANGDGRSDVFALWSNGTLTVTLTTPATIGGGGGTGSSGFGAPAYYALRTDGGAVRRILLADFQNDGRTDVLGVSNAASGGGSDLRKLVAGAGGVLTASAQSFAYVPAATADYNYDSVPDFAFVGPVQNASTTPVYPIHVSQTQPVAVFGTPFAINTKTFSESAGVAVVGFADLNSSNARDAVVQSGGAVTAVFGSNEGTRSFSGTFMGLADANADSAKELLVETAANDGSRANKLTATTLNGRGFNYTVQLELFAKPEGLAYADVNSDNHDDLVAVGRNIGNGACELQVYLSDRSSGLYRQKPDVFPASTRTLSACPTGVRLADVNGDGKRDAITYGPTAITVYPGFGYGDFVGTVTVPVATDRGAIQDVQAGDANGDGKADLYVLYANGTLGVSLAQ